MRPRPPLAKFHEYPLTAGLCLLAIGVTLLSYSGRSIEPFTMSGLHLLDQPWRMLTSILPHVGPMHLIFNIYWTWVFGTYLEHELGFFKLALITLILAAGSGVAELAIFEGGVGLSGVGYGYFGMLWVMRRSPRHAGVIDNRTVQLFLGWFLLCIVLTIFKIEPVANVAHGMGLALGAILGWFLITPKKFRPLPASILVLTLAAIFLAATVLRPLVNFSPEASSEYVNAGCDQIAAHRPQDALPLLEKASEFRYDGGYGWYNMGVAYQQLQDPEKALECFRRAVEIAPEEPKFQKALQDFQTALEEESHHPPSTTRVK